MTDTPDILKKIVEHKRGEVAAARSAAPLAEVKARIADLEDQPRGFERALRDCHASGWTAVIAEVKKGSPSKGVIRPDFDPLEIAETYEQNGAACLSVLTDEQFFLGNLRYLALIREQVRLPLLRKDFLFDPYQVYEARAAGADAILLIAAMLEPAQIEDLAGFAREQYLDVLLEVHDEQELETALASSCTLIGINNRNLRTFVTDLGTTERLIPMIPADRFVVTESGINTRDDILRLQAAGAHGFLIGESLMREEDIGAKLRELLG
ncbi:indole-3-glycerol phosphate synthase TrpC [Geobacter sulfurreducens]|uniref:Indole-3-glycerol phosphate synthase n=1 Tax=Geobacter sulfurreducens (strain ATCC 51573 / DSM 12127 / PCA) TaxID=243231 RepID=Q74AH5_GEOSL|nr:indole-3-glycerol phosphate synthase TrpC [Geobacter sulfurreducens]AAR35753.1 indole-3-glycerol-phosphate synthase [Geobacter sulfurreducens PCA]ADI85134.1 indole-3-glycerol-phosphate synthase [Geobacter sulfurreducens KN400]AJY68601.1 indole-3-glycerol phosphate synthase [Geobacter sulfurreducens]QVW34219.1 indole-3-glycerol phosphate synthase TrpC [Geobacter sulfurreducens]UAC03083.1 indole-3-glycerol phosphate synthase TrpC [Geobacter sulfurreducens]